MKLYTLEEVMSRFLKGLVRQVIQKYPLKTVIKIVNQLTVKLTLLLTATLKE